MSHRSVKYARQIKESLIDQLGAKCELCPCTNREKLEFDHRDGTVVVLNKLSYSARMSMYKREVEAGAIRLLCKSCNLSERRRLNGKFVRTAIQGVPLERIAF